MSYKAHFKGGPKHGDTVVLSTVQKVYSVTTVYDTSGFRTKSKYNLVKQEESLKKLASDLRNWKVILYRLQVLKETFII